MDEITVRTAVAAVLEVNPEDLKPETDLESVGYDSLARLSLMVCLSDLTGKELELAALRRIRTYGDILALLDGKTSK